MVWPYLKVFWLSRDKFCRAQCKVKDKKGKQKKRWEDNIKAWTGLDFSISTRAAEDRIRWKGVVVN